MNEACINEAIEDTTDGIYVLTQHASDEPEDVVVVVLKGIKGLVHPKMKILSLTIDSSTVERVSSTKFLGMHITEDLTWTTNTCHSPRRHNSTYTFSAGWKEQVSHHPSSHILQGHHWECADQLHHCLVRELQCCWPQDTPADSEHSCKDHRCPSPIHPGHFPCTMLQQNQQHREGPHPPLPQSLPAPTIRKMVPEHQSPLRQAAQQLFPPGCESPELRSPRPLWNPTQTPTPWNMDTPPPPSPNTPLTLPHQRKKTVNFFVQFKVCYTQVSGPVQTTCSKTLSSMRTRHFSHTAVCTQSHKRLSNICMFTCSCTTNHLVLFLSQLLDSQCFSLHMYSIYVKQSYSLYFLSFIFSCIG